MIHLPIPHSNSTLAAPYSDVERWLRELKKKQKTRDEQFEKFKRQFFEVKK